MEYISYLLIGIAVLFMLFQFYPLYKARSVRGREIDLDKTRYRPYLQGRSLIYFWSPGCGMCRNTTPFIEELAGQRDDVHLVDASAEPEIARAFHVMATPAFALVENGKVERLLLGAKSREQILRLLDDVQ
jgi:thioredoxin 1